LRERKPHWTTSSSLWHWLSTVWSHKHSRRRLLKIRQPHRQTYRQTERIAIPSLYSVGVNRMRLMHLMYGHCLITTLQSMTYLLILNNLWTVWCPA